MEHRFWHRNSFTLHRRYPRVRQSSPFMAPAARSLAEGCEEQHTCIWQKLFVYLDCGTFGKETSVTKTGDCSHLCGVLPYVLYLPRMMIIATLAGCADQQIDRELPDRKTHLGIEACLSCVRFILPVCMCFVIDGSIAEGC